MYTPAIVMTFEACAIQRVARTIVLEHYGRSITRMLDMRLAWAMAIGALHTVGIMEKAEHRVLLIVTRETFGIGCLYASGYQHQHHGQHDAGNYPLKSHFSSIHSWTERILSRSKSEYLRLEASKQGEADAFLIWINLQTRQDKLTKIRRVDDASSAPS